MAMLLRASRSSSAWATAAAVRGARLHSSAGFKSLAASSCHESTAWADLNRSSMLVPFKDSFVSYSKPFPLSKRGFAKVAGPAQLQRQVGMKLSRESLGVVLEPYKVHTRLPFFDRWFTREGWKQRKELYIRVLKTAFAIAQLRQKTGYNKKKFYKEAADLYKQTNSAIATGDRNTLRHLVTENMFSILKKELKLREDSWSRIHWEIVGSPNLQTLQARLASAEGKKLDNAFVQVTLMIRSKQKFGAYDQEGRLVEGDPTKELLVEDVWVLETFFGQPEKKWRLCARISL